MAARDSEVTIEDARLIFRNFAGKEDKYNRAGDRNFSILLTQEVAVKLEESGWNVKQLRAREEDDPTETQPYLQVAVSFKTRPPRIVMLSRRADGKMSRTQIPEDMVEMLDYSDVETCDVTLSPYQWTVGENSGTKAYLKTMFITIRVDPLELKYAEPDEDEGVAD